MASIAGNHLQLKEQFSLAEPTAIIEEPFASYLNLGGSSKTNHECKLAKIRRHIDVAELTEAYTECGPVPSTLDRIKSRQVLLSD